MSRQLRAALVSPETGAAVARTLGALEGAAFTTRLDLVLDDLAEALEAVYGATHDVEDLVRTLVDDALAAAAVRPEPLRVLDRRREVDPAWFLGEQMLGYVCYTDRFAGNLTGVGRHLDHLRDLGVTYLHLMPLLRPRDGENDGGYAVRSYTEVDPRLGDMADLEELAWDLHEQGIALCVDLVLNHTAAEHEWAQKALAGDPAYEDFYLFFPDRSGPDAYERTLPEVFPDLAPGSFTELPDGRWVWTTFHEYQWDLNWANPAVLRAMLQVMFDLGNLGVDVLRLDAAPFLWKRLGTDCQNQPEAHRLLQAIRALTRLAMPGLLLKAEAIVGPDQLVPYLGGHERFRPECDLAYDNQLMVMLWSSLATRDVRLAEHALRRRPPAPAGRGWVTYVRCHDDIGWAVADEDAWAVGLDPAAHRRFLADFYAGRHPGSFARGLDFQVDPATGSGRTSGSAASLAGVEAALRDGSELDVRVSLLRLELLYAVAFSFGGIPLLYMGDEVALLNDPDWAADPAHADDNRWLHRPVMDWTALADDAAPGARAHRSLRRLAEARRRTPSLRSDAETRLLEHGNPHLLAYVREHPRHAPVLVLACFADEDQHVHRDTLLHAGIDRPVLVHATTGAWEWMGDHLVVPAWGYLWIAQEDRPDGRT